MQCRLVVAINFEVIGLCTCQILKWNEGLGYVCTQQTENLSSSIRWSWCVLFVMRIKFESDICDLADYIWNEKHHDFFYNPIILFVC